MVPEWPAPNEVRALSTYRSGGASAAPYASLNLGDHVGESLEAVAENRRRLAAAAALTRHDGSVDIIAQHPPIMMLRQP